ncbi:MFS transporter [Candidatus Harpocratesius sp.]
MLLTQLKKSRPKKIWNNLNYNVKIVLLFTLFQSIGRGIWMGNVLSSYIYIIAGNSNELLGWTSGATGIMMTIVVFPAGALADRFRRDWMLFIAGGIGIIGMIILFFADNLQLVIIALLFWGLYQGVTRPALESLFADSVPSGNRSRIYSIRQFIQQFGMMVGPMVNIILFSFFGDEWHLPILKKVMGIGIIFSIGSLVLMFFFSDRKSLGAKSDAIDNREKIIQDHSENKLNVSNNSLINSKSSNINSNSIMKRKFTSIRIKKKAIPYILVSSNILIGLGAGMTVKFFPIFFMEIYGMKPILVQGIMGITFLTTGILGLIAQHYSRAKGRAQMIFTVQFLATLCLIAIAFYPPEILLIIIFIARGSLMNAAQPLSRSILMDIVPKNKRGKWNSVEALAWGLFWNASAVVGGYLIGSGNNFQLNFLVTAGIYVLSSLPLLTLFNAVDREL